MNKDKDIEFLVHRQLQANRFGSTDGSRDTGSSSNSIVAIAYGVYDLDEQVLPLDSSDLQACKNMWKKLPDHRKTEAAIEAMIRAGKAIKQKEA